MKDYNGFSAAERNAAQRWLEKEWMAGRLARPAKCCACGQDQGIIDAHAEDYSRPFGSHLCRFPLCYICHMMLHCRFGRGQAAWEHYRACVRAGIRYAPALTRNFGIIQRFLGGNPAREWSRHTEPTWLVLDEIHDGKVEVVESVNVDGVRTAVESIYVEGVGTKSTIKTGVATG